MNYTKFKSAADMQLSMEQVQLCNYIFHPDADGRYQALNVFTSSNVPIFIKKITTILLIMIVRLY